MRGEGILSENHDERGRSFAPGRGKGRDAGPRCAAAACARHAHRAVRRHIRSAACGASRRLPAGDAAGLASTGCGGWSRPGNPLKDTRGLAPLADAHRRRAGAGAPSAHRRHRPRGGARHAPTPTRPCPICGGAVPACTSSGSWAPTICAASIAGSAGAASPNLVPIAVVDRLGPSLYATGERRRRRRWRATGFPKRRRGSLRTASRRPGSFCTASNRRCRRRRCAPRAR